MNDERWADVDRYLTALFARGGPALPREPQLPAHEVSALQGKLLELLARMQGARRILELGTLGGYSTLWLARALPPDGRLVTLEANTAYAEVARANIARAGLTQVVELHVGPALETLARLEGAFDFVFLDADKRSNPEYLAWALRLSRPGTVIVADNVVRAGAVIEAGSRDPTVQGVRRFLELVAAEPRVDATVIQTVGAKGYDGFAVALVE